MPVYIEPFYNSQPFKIDVGEYSNKLSTNNETELLSVASEIKRNIDKVNLPTLYVLAIRLYDMGKKDEAVYWFYTAQFRTKIFKETLANEAAGRDELQAATAFKQLSGVYINGYAFGNLDKNIEIIKQVIKDNQSTSGLNNAYTNIKFDNSKLSGAISDAVADRQELIKYIEENKESIKEQRKENGIEGKY